MALEQCQTFFSAPDPERFKEGRTFYSTGVKHIPGETSQKILLAYDVANGAVAWKYQQIGLGHSSGGTMTTASRLVFFGGEARSFESVNANAGIPLGQDTTGPDIK